MAIKFLSSENIAGDIDVTLSKNGITYLAVTNTDTGVSANARVQVVGESSQLDLIATSAGYTGVSGWADSGIISTDSGASGGLKLNSQAGGIQLQAATTSYVIMDASGFLGVNMTPDTGVRLSVSGAIGPTNGTEGAPTHTFYGDPNTGMFRSAADTLGFSTGGTTRLSVRAAGINVVGQTETDTLLCSGISTLASSVAIGGSFSPDRTLDVRGTGLSIYGTGNNTELMLRGQVEGTGTVRNLGAFHLSIRGDVGGDNDDLKFLRFVNGTYNGITMQISNSNGNATFFNDVNTTNRLAFKETTYGYSTTYKVLQLGSAVATSSISIGYDPNGNASGSFSGNEILIPNNIRILAPNAADDAFFGCMIFDSNNKLLLGSSNYLIENNNIMTLDPSTKNVGIGAYSPSGKLEVAGGTTYGFRLSNAGDQSAYDQVRMTYGGYNSGAPTVTFMPLTTPGGGNVDTTYHFSNSNGLNANNNRANVNIDGILYVGSGRQSGETTLIMRNYDTALVDSNEIQNSIRMSGRYWSGSASQLVETRINSVHQESNGNGGSALTFWTQTGGSAANEKLRIDKSGRVIVYQKENVSGFYLDGSNTRLYANGGGGTDYRGIECNSSGMWSWGETGTSNYFAKPIGIGTTSPQSKLDLVQPDSSANTLGQSVTASIGIRMANAVGQVGQIVFNNDAAPSYGYGSIGMIMTSGSGVGLGDMIFATKSTGADNASTERLRITSGGRVQMTADVTMSGSVGIGETALQRKFNLYDGTDTWTRVQCGASTADWLHGIAGSDHTYKWYNQSSNGGVGYKMALATSGTLTVSADLVAYGSPSDKRLKENIKPIKSALDKVSKLQGVTFDWKKSDSILDIKKDIGFIAQDVQKVVPELVRENEDGMLSMRHQGVTPILLEAIKELKAEIEELKKQIN